MFVSKILTMREGEVESIAEEYVKLKSHGRSERRLTAGTEKEYRIFIF
jgi:hypothetical protein